MKYPRLASASTPSSLLVWLDEQLESRGIDGVYTRYILSLLVPSREPHECEHTRIPQFDWQWPVKPGHQRRSWHCYKVAEWDLCSCTSSPDSKKSAAVECLKAATEQELGLETLIEEVCEKLDNLRADLELFGKESLGSSHFVGPPTPPPSPKEHKQKYFAAFPSLTEKIASPQPLLGSKESSPELMTENSLVIPLLPFTKMKSLVKKKKQPFLDHKPRLLKYRNEGDSLLKSPQSKRKREDPDSPVQVVDDPPAAEHPSSKVKSQESLESPPPMNGNGAEASQPELTLRLNGSVLEPPGLVAPADEEGGPVEALDGEEWDGMLLEKQVGKENVVPMDLTPPPIKYRLFSEGSCSSLWPLSFKDKAPQIPEQEVVEPCLIAPASKPWTLQPNGLQEKNEDLDQELDSSLHIQDAPEESFTKINKPLASNSNWTFQSNGLYSSQYNVVQARKHCYINGLTSKPYLSASLDERKLSPTFFLHTTSSKSLPGLSAKTSSLLASCYEKLKNSGRFPRCKSKFLALDREEDIPALADSSFYPLDPFPLLSNNCTFMDSRILYKRLEEESRVYHIWKPSSNSSSMEALPLSMEELLSSEKSSSTSFPPGGDEGFATCGLGGHSQSGDSLSSEGSSPFFEDSSSYRHLEEEEEEMMEENSPAAHRYKTAGDFHKTKSKFPFVEAPANKRPCTYFMEGSCLKPNCRFSHDLKTITCKFWLMNQCFKGETCPFLHGFLSKRNAAKTEKLQQRFTLESELDFPPLSLSPKEFPEGGGKNSSSSSKKKLG